MAARLPYKRSVISSLDPCPVLIALLHRGRLDSLQAFSRKRYVTVSYLLEPRNPDIPCLLPAKYPHKTILTHCRHRRRTLVSAHGWTKGAATANARSPTSTSTAVDREHECRHPNPPNHIATSPSDCERERPGTTQREPR